MRRHLLRGAPWIMVLGLWIVLAGCTGRVELDVAPKPTPRVQPSTDGAPPSTATTATEMAPSG